MISPKGTKKSSKICIINFSGYAFQKTMILHGIRMPMSGDLKLHQRPLVLGLVFKKKEIFRHLAIQQTDSSP
jgi:hypothetical protein